MHVGQAIKETRKMRGLNQVKLAAGAGITQTYLSQIETGDKLPSMDVLQRLSKKLNAPLPILFWRGIQEKDVKKERLTIYREMKPAIDSFINTIFN